MRHLRQAQLEKFMEDIQKERDAAEQEFLKDRIMYLSQYYPEFHDRQQNQPADRLFRIKPAKVLQMDKVSPNGAESSEISPYILEQALQIQQKISLIRNIAGFVEKELHFDGESAAKRSKNMTIEDTASHSNELTKDEKQKERLKALKHKWHLYSGFSLNMDYQGTKLLSVSEREKQSELAQQSRQYKHKLFECDNEDLSSKIEQVNISSRSISLSSWLYRFENKSKPIDHLDFSVSSFPNEYDYYKFDDSLATLFLAKPDCHFKQISIKFDCCAKSLLTVLRFLLFVKSCNIINIQPLSITAEEHKDLLKWIFYLIFSMKNLQEIQITNIGTILPELTAGLVRADPKTSNISSVIMNNNSFSQYQNTNQIADYFESMSQLPKLINFECSSLELSGYRLQAIFSRFVEKLQFANINLLINRHYPPYLPLSNLITFEGTIVFQQNEFINERLNSFLSSFQDASQIQSFTLFASVQHNYHYLTRKQILIQARKEKELQKEREKEAKIKIQERKKLKLQNKKTDEKKKTNENKESAQIEETTQKEVVYTNVGESSVIVEETSENEIVINKVEEPTEKEAQEKKVGENEEVKGVEEERIVEEQVDEVEIDFKDFPKENRKWFNHLKNNSNLTKFNVKISSINKDIFDGLVDFLSTSTKIYSFNFECQQHERLPKKTEDLQEEEEQENYRTNFKSLYEILNDLVYIRQFSFKVESFKINYNLRNENTALYDLSIEAPLNFSEEFAVPSFLEFSLKKVQSIQVNIGKISVLKMLDNLLKSVSNSEMTKSLEINISEFNGLKKFIEKLTINKSELLFFKHFDSLKYLEHLKLKVPFNQNVLDSISGFLRESQELKSFIFQRTSQQLKQYYLNYTVFLAAIAESKSLQQLYLSTGIDRIQRPRKGEYISIWNSDKITNFFAPLSQLLRNAPESLRTIEFDEGYSTSQGLQLVIQSLIHAPVLLYTKFDQSTVSNIQYSQDNALIELYNEAIKYGIIARPSYRFPLTQDATFTTISTYSNYYTMEGERFADTFNNEDEYEKFVYNFQKYQQDEIQDSKENSIGSCSQFSD